MGFASLLDRQVKGAMKILGTEDGGLAGVQTYIVTSPTSASYDTSTGEFTSPETPYTGVPMVLASFTSNEIDGSSVERTDLKAIIAALDLVDSSGTKIVPKVQDKIYTTTKGNFVVKRLMGVPGDSAHIIHIGLTE